MAIIATNNGGGGSFEPVSAGAHIAVCTAVIDLGMQENKFNGGFQQKVLITWTIPGETINIDGEDKPRVISNRYTLSLNEKANLRHHLEAWRGKIFSDEELSGFDLKNILGCACQVNVVHSQKGERTYANVNAIMSIPKGMKIDTDGYELIYFDLSDADCLPIMGKLPEWIQNEIKQSSTYKELASPPAPPDDAPDWVKEADAANAAEQQMVVETPPKAAAPAPKSGNVITEKQAVRLLRLAANDEKAVLDIIAKYGFDNIADITEKSYDAIFKEIDEALPF